MNIGQPRVTRMACGGTAVTCEVSVGGTRREAFYRTAGVPLPGVGVEPFACTSVVPAMRTGEPISAAGPVSARLAGAMPAIQDTLIGWYPDLRRAALDAPTRPLDPGPAGRGVACFFSGGVDSFYSVLQHDHEVDTLVFAHGFDVPLSNTALRQRVGAELRAAAASLGKRLIEVETNARELLDPYGNWGTHTHGSALASVAHLLAGLVRKVYVPSSFDRGERFAWGSHPLLDPLWSSEAVEVVHDDVNVTRYHKTTSIARSDIALAHLRVCWENRDNAYNCGRCEKCVRTMLTLRLAGALDRCGTFAAPLDLSVVQRLPVTTPSRRSFYQEILEGARQAGDRPVVRAVEAVLFPSRRRRTAKWIFRKAGWVKRKVLRH